MGRGGLLMSGKICNTFRTDGAKGPKEFLNYIKYGIMFKSNSKDIHYLKV